MRLATASSGSPCASWRSARAGISAISRAIADSPICSAIASRSHGPDGGAEIVIVLLERLGGVVGLHSKRKQHGEFHVAVGRRQMTRCFGAPAACHAAHDGLAPLP